MNTFEKLSLREGLGVFRQTLLALLVLYYEIEAVMVICEQINNGLIEDEVKSAVDAEKLALALAQAASRGGSFLGTDQLQLVLERGVGDLDAYSTSLSLRRLTGTFRTGDFLTLVRVVLTGAYTADQAEVIVLAIANGIVYNETESNRMIKGALRVEKMAKAISELAVRGGCQLDRGELESSIIGSMNRLDHQAQSSVA